MHKGIDDTEKQRLRTNYERNGENIINVGNSSLLPNLDLYNYVGDPLVATILTPTGINMTELLTYIDPLTEFEEKNENFTSIDKTLLHQAEMIIARQLYDHAAYRDVMTRMNDYIQRNNAPEAKAFLGLALLKQAEYEQAFMLDEQFDSSGLSDPWLEAEYQSVFAEAVDIYFTSSLANN